MASIGTSRICIIGGGAAGLAALKVILEAEDAKVGSWELTLFEAREHIGGVWFPSPPHPYPPASPLYDTLTTNLPHPVMAFQSHWFPPGTPLFPRAPVVLAYLRTYAEKFDLLKHIVFNMRVEEAVWDGHSWEVRLQNGVTQRFDKIVVANGHFSDPRYPKIPGLQGWIDTGKASHSVFYRNARPFRSMRVLVIGGGPSGQDISAEVSTVASAVYFSVKGSPSEDVGKLRRRGEVLRLEEPSTVVFADGSVSDIDHTILATGYNMSLPFLPQLRQGTMPKIPPIPSHIINSTYNIFPLAKHIFPFHNNSLLGTIAFVGLLVRVAPFPLFEAQGRWISKVFSDPGRLDPIKELESVVARYDQLKEQFGDDATVIAKRWHRFQELEQFSYRRELLDLSEAGETWYPEDWAEEMYCARDQLRSAWLELEKTGRANDWVRGIGEGGRHEWVSMMRRLLDINDKP